MSDISPSDGRNDVARGPVIVAGHVCLDVIPSFPAMAKMPSAGHLTEVGAAVVSTGGAVANTGLALHKLGFPVRLVALAGEDLFGRTLSELLAASGAEVRLRTRSGISTSYSVVLSPAGSDRGFLHSPGANHEFSPDDVTDADLDGASALHFGYPQAMRRTFEDGGAALARLFGRAAARGMITSLDTCFPDPTSAAGRVDWPGFFRAVLPNVSMFCPSIDELPMLIGRPQGGDLFNHLHRIAGDFIDMGAAAVAIKLGAEGLYLRTSSDAARIRKAKLPPTWRARELRAPCFAADVVSATGAGDCTIAGLIASSLVADGPVEALMHATAVGAFSVESSDATGNIPSWRKVLARIAAGWRQREMRSMPGFALLMQGVYAGANDSSQPKGETQ